ncbi:ATP-binding protein [Streptomyces triticirhizae]|uniref:ATP-binding protein n=1 Tax=Streptomyces triticirhizae TaxID=2483353 RepID=A0A3M2L1L4_9ACTN|nr:ATP-binding protein [Streptomyces triticirhizae]RMI31629.1 ATP-binding protein [Streptomyces triticirhizae]
MPVTIARIAEDDATYAWDLVACTSELEHWRAIAAGTVGRLGGDRDAVALTRLGVTELISNVIKHVAHDPRCRLVVTCESDKDVRISVCDRSLRVPKLTVPDWSSESGRGLWLLCEMAPAWGCTRLAEGKSVWFRFPLACGDGEEARR